MARYIEYSIQRELIKWVKQEYNIEIIWVKNEGKKTKQSAVLDKASGLEAGFPDLMLFKPVRSVTHILHLELKKIKGVMSPTQKEWHTEFKETRNRKAVIAYGFLEAQEKIREWYEQAV